MLIEHLERQLSELDKRSLRRRRRTAESPCAPRQRVRDDGANARDMLAFCSNDYLGLANHPAVVEALVEGARRYGTGSGASHLISGHSRAHDQLEDELAQWLAPCIPNVRVLSFCTGYMANLALLTALGSADATIFADKLNHASLVDGALLAKAPLRRFIHGKLDVLTSQLERCSTPIKLIATDAVFSMDGDQADLPALLALAEAHDAWLLVDDAHGFGVLGERGRGSLSHFHLSSERFIYMGTFGKAAGVGGAFVAAHPTVIDWLVQSARSYIYTTAQPPALAQAIFASLRLIRSDDGQARRAHLNRLIAILRQGLNTLVAEQSSRGWYLAESSTAIQALIVGDNNAALTLAAALDAQGLWVPAIRPPTVAIGRARLRITLSAAHTVDDVKTLTNGLAQAAKGLQ
jgi:8-amino-7-oxononanoate synthase